VWNAVLNYFYEIHKLSKEEIQKYSFKLKYQDASDFLSGEVDKMPDLSKEPQVQEVKEHIIRFVNNVLMDKPRKHILVKEMVPLNILTPVGAEKILYPYEFITHIDNTQNSFLQHLIDSSPQEWINFKKKECNSAKAQDWAERMEKDILQGAAIETKKKQKRWIHNTTEGQLIKRKLCEWASIRFQALFRTVNGFMQVPRALEILARIEDPRMSQSEAEVLVRQKFSYLMGYQSFSNFQKLYKKTKDKAKSGEDLTRPEAEAHDAVYNIKYIKTRFPEVKIAYPDIEDGKYYARMMSGISKSNGNEFYDYKIELFGPFGDMGLGKPAHQNFLVQFLDGLVIQAIDVNQDNVLGQSFFVPNVLAEFDRDKKIKIIGCPEFIVTTNWSSTAWCSAFAEHNFGTMVQRCYARLGLRFHYGHPDYIDAMSVMTESGMSKMPYVSEDIFTGFDVVLKGGRVIHIEYHEVGKARDVDLYTTTKFQRKISMGASQMACTRYIDQLQTTWNANLAQKWSFYYTTVGFYVNVHPICIQQYHSHFHFYG
jgi:1,3-beta-glucan synthase